jgi:hypothetical protein
MLLMAVRRIGEYVKLLTWFELHTPRTHADRQDLNNAIATLTELDRGMREVGNVFTHYLAHYLAVDEKSFAQEMHL